jgi:exodeoxyribonuclease VII large subunit
LHWEDKRGQGKIYTVSGFTSELKLFLEEKYPFVWIQGEISNLSRPSSGHLYFSVKDSKAQISAVIFRNMGNHLTFTLENGLQITGLARLSVYEPRGTYQLIFEFIEPKGTGALQLAFEQLKKRLSAEGLFDNRHKKPLPKIPDHISIVTSSSGAVIHDIMNIINRRFPNIVLEIFPVKVQGESSEKEICLALSAINERNRTDLIVIARGGGSIEDLASFNTESVARALFQSRIPVVSAVGHETDYTICDFVADLRAPTPSAAAELIVPQKSDLQTVVQHLNRQLVSRMTTLLEKKRTQLESASSKLVDPKRKIIDMRLLTEDYTQRMIRCIQRTVSRQAEHLSWKNDRLFKASPSIRVNIFRNEQESIRYRLASTIKTRLHHHQLHLGNLTGKLTALSPTAILSRGYSITRTVPQSVIVKNSRDVIAGQSLEIILAEGTLHVNVQEKKDHG